MRLIVVLSLLACSLFSTPAFAAWDIFQSYVIIDAGSGNQFLAGGYNADAATAFNGSDLGTFAASDALTLNGGELKTYKNGSSNVCGGNVYYRVYASGDTPGSFSSVALPYDSDLTNPGDQKWDETAAGVDLLAGLTAGGAYTLEVYWDLTGADSDPGGCGETKYDSDFGNNFTASFTFNVPGCTDSDYAEYDANANTDDGSCTTFIDPCDGALVLGSIEVDLSTTTLTAEDGSATLTITTGTPTSLTLSGINGAGDYTFAQPGTIDGLATGYYTVTATDADGCTSNTLQLVIPYSLCCDCGVYDADTDGICDDTDNCTDRDAANYNDPANGTCIFYGCTNPAAVNYDASANTDDGSCIIYGCTDAAYTQYNPAANTDDGSCSTLIVEGCTDPAAANYNAAANTDDGSCLYPGCMDPAYQEYDASANTDDGSCSTLIVEGCTDSAAANYDPAANVDDGSCLFPGCMDPAYQEYDATANTDDGSCSTLIVEGCTDPAADNYDPAANTDDGSCIITGCTDSNADNYNAAANTDDGSCIVTGCMDPAFEEYNPDANTDDGSCSTPAYCSPVDMDGVTYDVVEIDDQCWFTFNLRSSVYADGTPIPYVGWEPSGPGGVLSEGTAGDIEWANDTEGGQCVNLHNNVSSDGSWYSSTNPDFSCDNYEDTNLPQFCCTMCAYGRLYNHHAVTHPSGLCPTDWHVPTDADWTQLTDYVASQGHAGNEGTALKGTDDAHWHNGDQIATDAFGLAITGQSYRKEDGAFSLSGAQFGYYWRSTPDGNGNGWVRLFRWNSPIILRIPQSENKGLYVRCIKDAQD